MEDLKKGDKLVDGCCDELEVITCSSIYGNGKYISVYITKDSDDDLEVYTLAELREDGYKLKPDTVELTVEELQDKLGYKIKIVESK